MTKRAIRKEADRDQGTKDEANPKLEPIKRLTWPRRRAGMSSLIAELIAVYSPPMPAPVIMRQSKNVGMFHESAVMAVAQA